jgi:hypothetical protein
MINVFPPLYEIGQNMCANFMNWGDRRKMEISNDEKMTDKVKAVETGKIVEKMTKYKEKMAFLDAYQMLPRRGSNQRKDGNGSAPQLVRRGSIKSTT